MPDLNLTTVQTVVVSATPISFTDAGSTIGSTDPLLLQPTEAEETMQLSKKIDNVEATDFIYIGEALPGSSASASVWRIKKINENAGLDDDIEITWAEGTATFSHKWSDRLTITYT